MRSCLETIRRIIDILPDGGAKSDLTGFVNGVHSGLERQSDEQGYWNRAASIMTPHLIEWERTKQHALYSSFMNLWHEDLTPIPAKPIDEPHNLTHEQLEKLAKNMEARADQFAASRSEWCEKAHALEKENQRLVDEVDELKQMIRHIKMTEVLSCVGTMELVDKVLSESAPVRVDAE